MNSKTKSTMFCEKASSYVCYSGDCGMCNGCCGGPKNISRDISSRSIPWMQRMRLQKRKIQKQGEETVSGDQEYESLISFTKRYCEYHQ